MSNKTFAIVVTVVVLLTTFPILLVSFWDTSDSTNNAGNTAANTDSPTLELSLNTEQPEQTEVIITAVGRATGTAGIAAITLPNGSIQYSNQASYTVTENGEYSFEVETQNGQRATSQILVTNIKGFAADNPYMPDGFSFLEGTVADGYVIKDEAGNEYVWVPVESGEMVSNIAESSEYEENEDSVAELIESVGKYFGFYIARYETGIYRKEENSEKYIASTMNNQEPWTNIMYTTARDVAANSAKEFGYTDCKTALVSSYAWDTALAWMDMAVENYSASKDYGNYFGPVLRAGATEIDKVNHICDMAGNVSEWTTEKYKENSRRKKSSTRWKR